MIGAIVVALLVGLYVAPWVWSLTWYRAPGARLDAFPRRAPKGVRIVINAGHRGTEKPGAVGTAGLHEVDVNLDVARRCSLHLASLGAHVFLQRGGRSLGKTCRQAESLHPDLWLSIHHNATWRTWPLMVLSNRSEVYYKETATIASKESKRAAQAVARRLRRHLGLRAPVIGETKQTRRKHSEAGSGRFTAILIEASYMSNPFQERLLSIPAKRELEAQAICAGVLDYFTAAAGHSATGR